MYFLFFLKMNSATGASFSRMNLSAWLVVNFFSLRRIIYVFFFLSLSLSVSLSLSLGFISIFMTLYAFSVPSPSSFFLCFI